MQETTPNPTRIDNVAHFVFDSEHPEEIQTRLYGFYTTAEGLFTEPPAGQGISDATGAWVLVRREGDRIQITQDTIGCFGLFLYREGSYWALSNSFNHLLDYLKESRSLSLNKDYATAFLAQSVCVSVYGQTIINEIAWLDRRAVLVIDTATSKLAIEHRTLDERSIPIDTEEGLRVLDAWHDKWTAFMRRTASSWPGAIKVDVSGGFDTRMALAPILSAGLRLDDIWFYSHPHREEDYQIAKLMADEFGFVLNATKSWANLQDYPPVEDYQERTLDAIYFEKEIYAKLSKTPTPTVVLSGFGGEMLRDYGGHDKSALVSRELYRLKNAGSLYRSAALRQSMKSILIRSCNAIGAMLEQTDGRQGKGMGLNGLQFYAETRNRSHFGMSIARDCLSYSYRPALLLDPLLLKLRLPASGAHPLLIAALIFMRYHDNLASFPFEGGRNIPEETLALARELNERFPYNPSAVQKASSASDVPIWQIPQNGKADIRQTSERDLHSPASSRSPMNESLLKAFEAPMVQEPFVNLFGDKVFSWLDPRLDERHPNANKFAAVVIAKVMDDVQRGKDAHRNLASFVEAAVQQAHQEPCKDVQIAWTYYRRQARVRSLLDKMSAPKRFARKTWDAAKRLLHELKP